MRSKTKMRNLDKRTSKILDLIPFPQKLPDKFPIANGTSEGCIVISVFDLHNGRASDFLRYGLNFIETLISKTDIVHTKTPIFLAIDRNMINLFPSGYNFPEENLLFLPDWDISSNLDIEQFRLRYRYAYIEQLKKYKWGINLDADLLILGKQQHLCRRLRNAFNTGHQLLALKYSGTRFDNYIRNQSNKREILLEIKKLLSVTNEELDALQNWSKDYSVPNIFAGLVAMRYDLFEGYNDFVDQLSNNIWLDEMVIFLWVMKNKITVTSFTRLISRYFLFFRGGNYPSLQQFIDTGGGITGINKMTDQEQELLIAEAIKKDTGLIINTDLLK